MCGSVQALCCVIRGGPGYRQIIMLESRVLGKSSLFFFFFFSFLRSNPLFDLSVDDEYVKLNPLHKLL